MQIAIEKGRKTRPDIKLSICGEHGGEPREEDVTRLPNHQAAPGIQSGFLFAVTANHMACRLDLPLPGFNVDRFQREDSLAWLRLLFP